MESRNQAAGARPIDQIYGFDSELKWSKERIARSEKIDQDTKQTIFAFIDHIAALPNGAGAGRQAKYLYHLLEICERIGKPMKDVQRRDVEKLMNSLTEGYVPRRNRESRDQRQARESSNQDKKHFSPETINDFIMATKRFMKFLRNGNVDRNTPFPPEVAWLRKVSKPVDQTEPEFLMPQEVESMVSMADLQRDRAMLAVGYEGGLRAGELLTANVRDVMFDEIGARIKVRGRTGERTVRLIASSRTLALYLETYRYRNLPDMPLWCSESKNRYDQRLKFTGWTDTMKRLALKAGINKRVHNHMLKHGSATEAAKFLTDSEMKKRYGWSMNSKMPQVYIHLSGKDIDDKLQRMNEGKALEPPKPQFAQKVCVRCSEKNGPGTRFCGKCGTPLNQEEIVRAGVAEQVKERDLQETVLLLAKKVEQLEAAVAASRRAA